MPALGREFAGDAGFGGGLRVVAAQPLPVLPGPGNRSVEGEADGVQDAGLARAGGAVEQEEPVCAEPVEVDPLRAGKRAEGGRSPGGGSSQGHSFQAHGLQSLGEDARLRRQAPAADVLEESAADGEVILGFGKPAAVAGLGGAGPSGSKPSTRVSGNRARRRSIAWAGRASVSVIWQ